MVGIFFRIVLREGFESGIGVGEVGVVGYFRLKE